MHVWQWTNVHVCFVFSDRQKACRIRLLSIFALELQNKLIENIIVNDTRIMKEKHPNTFLNSDCSASSDISYKYIPISVFPHRICIHPISNQPKNFAFNPLTFI